MTPLTVLRAADGRRMPWKNGGGDTIEIACHPAPSDLDAVDWRVSMATVSADGAFSTFPGLDRTLTIVEGEGLALTIDRQDPIRLDATSDPLHFPADVACTGRLLSGPITNLNVMTRRSRFRHLVTRLNVADPMAVTAEATTLVVCCAGTIAVEDRVLERHDVLVSHGPRCLALTAGGSGTRGVLVTVRPR